MFGKSRIDQPNGAPPTTKTNGAMMLLKSMGFDPQEFMKTINGARAEYEQAKVASVATVVHFNARLDKIETRLEILATRLDNLMQLIQAQQQMLGSVVSGLKVTTEPNETKPNVTGGVVAGGTLVED